MDEMYTANNCKPLLLHLELLQIYTAVSESRIGISCLASPIPRKDHIVPSLKSLEKKGMQFRIPPLRGRPRSVQAEKREDARNPLMSMNHRNTHKIPVNQMSNTYQI